MSRIEEVLNLPKLEDALREIEDQEKDEDDTDATEPASEREYEIAIQGSLDLSELDLSDKMLREHDREMDRVANEAFKHHETFMELSVDVPHKDAEAFVQGAVQMLTLAMNARKDKLDKRLRFERLQIDKERIDMQKQTTQAGIIEGEGSLLADRNELLDRLLGKKS